MPSFAVNWKDYLRLIIFSCAMVVLAHPGLWLIGQHSFSADSLFTLSPWQIAGLMILSTVMALITLWISIAKSRWLYARFARSTHIASSGYSLVVIDSILAVLLCLIAFAFAPQIHYLYYQQLFTALPNQWLIGTGLSINQIVRFITLPPGSSIAQYANGLVLWLCVISSALYPLISVKWRWASIVFLVVSVIAGLRLLSLVNGIIQ